MLIVKSYNRYYAFNDVDNIIVKTNFDDSALTSASTKAGKVTGSVISSIRDSIRNSDMGKAIGSSLRRSMPATDAALKKIEDPNGAVNALAATAAANDAIKRYNETTEKHAKKIQEIENKKAQEQEEQNNKGNFVSKAWNDLGTAGQIGVGAAGAGLIGLGMYKLLKKDKK